MSEAQKRWLSLPADAPRDVWFAALREAISSHYLAEPDDPFRESGRTSGAIRWLPNERGAFSVANAYYWKPTRTYAFVRTNLEYTPRADWVEFARRQFAAGSAGGRLILCHYRNTGEAAADVAAGAAEVASSAACSSTPQTKRSRDSSSQADRTSHRAD